MVCKSLFKNYEGACFCAKGQMTRRNDGASPKGAVTEAQRSQMAFCAKTLRAVVLLGANAVETQHEPVTSQDFGMLSIAWTAFVQVTLAR